MQEKGEMTKEDFLGKKHGSYKLSIPYLGYSP